MDLAAGATLDVNGARATAARLTGAGSVKLGGGTIVIANTEDNIFDGVISGAGSLVKTGTGALTLSGSNTFTTATAVSNGTLVLSGALASPVTVAGGATLGGAGTITGDLVLDADATLASRLPGPALSVQGNLALDGTLDVTDAGGFGTGTYTVVTYTGALTDNGLAVGAASDPVFVCTVDTNAPGEVRLNVALTPFAAWQAEHFRRLDQRRRRVETPIRTVTG